MANIVTIGLDQTSADLLDYALASGHHQISHEPEAVRGEVLNRADIVFAGGERKKYLPILKQVRTVQPGLPFVVVTRLPETADWLDALEAGATDYCAPPFDPRHMNWLMETALPAYRVAAA